MFKFHLCSYHHFTIRWWEVRTEEQTICVYSYQWGEKLVHLQPLPSVYEKRQKSGNLKQEFAEKYVSLLFGNAPNKLKVSSVAYRFGNRLDKNDVFWWKTHLQFFAAPRFLQYNALFLLIFSEIVVIFDLDLLLKIRWKFKQATDD